MDKKQQINTYELQEEQILNVFLTTKWAVDKYIKLVKPEYFFNINYKNIFEIIQETYDKYGNVDIFDFVQVARKNNRLEDFGGMNTINKITSTILLPTENSFAINLSNLVENFNKRELKRICNSTITNINNFEYYELRKNIQEIIEPVKLNIDIKPIDLTKQLIRPPVVLTIKENGFDKRIFTLGNISTINGKRKSRKTWLTSFMVGRVSEGKNYEFELINGSTIEGKDIILYFDTEQARWDAQQTQKIIEKIGGTNKNLFAFELREFSPMERLNIINYQANKYKDRIKLIVIDGIIDLSSKGKNDEPEAIELFNFEARITAKYNCHITNIIHQTKANEWSTGHVGSIIENKSEIVIECKEVIGLTESASSVSEVICQCVRGSEKFKTFYIGYENNLPKVYKTKEEHGMSNNLEF